MRNERRKDIMSCSNNNNNNNNDSRKMKTPSRERSVRSCIQHTRPRQRSTVYVVVSAAMNVK
jgi:hypothetical protein